jgi:transposase InsO family protein
MDLHSKKIIGYAYDASGIIHSFRIKGNPYDNAFIESLYSILKRKKSIIKNTVISIPLVR